MAKLDLPPVDPEVQPEPVRGKLTDLRERLGFVPNLYRVFAHAPGVLDAYLAMSAFFRRGTLSAT